MGRTLIRIRGKANEALMELSKKTKLSPSQMVETTLIRDYDALTDERLFQKKLFECSVVFSAELPFCFPYEFEEFEFQTGKMKARLYLERVPKRKLFRLPFSTIATSVVELAPEEAEFAKQNKANVTTNTLREKYSVIAYNLIKNIIISFRRVTNDYYNIGIIEPPVSLEEFEQKVQMSIILDSQEYHTSRFVPVKEDSHISSKETLDQKLRLEIITLLGKLESKRTGFLADPDRYLDAATVFYYQEQWNLCLLDSVIAMESGMSSLVFDSNLTKHYLAKRGSHEVLRKIYREKTNLPKKIESFLFPMMQWLNLPEIIIDLGKMMPHIYNKKTKDGIYDLRSRIVHEGVSVGKDEAEESITICSQFLKILRSVNDKTV